MKDSQKMTLLKKLNSEKGTSLIEVLCSAFLVTSVVVTLSLAFPTVTKNIITNQNQMTASQLASSTIATLRSQPYAYVDSTDASLFATAPSCDCALLDASSLPPQDSHLGATTYHVTSCVNNIRPATGTSSIAQCPADGDTGYKQILVRVTWKQGTQIASLAQEALISRF